MSNLSVDPLPLKNSLSREYAISVTIAVLMSLASAGGIIYQDVFYPIGESSVGFVATDVLNLAVGLPVLLVSMLLTRRGHLAGLLCWPGALLYVLYVYTSCMALPMRVLLIPHMLLIALSAYSMIGIVMKIDSDAVRRRIGETAPAKSSGYILTGIGVLVVAYQVVNIATSVISRTAPDALELVQWIDDLVIGSPAIFGGGYLLLRRRALGFVTGAGLLLMCSLLFVGVIPAMVFQARATNAPVDLIGIFVVLVTGMICFIPFVLFVRGMATTKPA